MAFTLKKSPGFTMIELLVSIAILGILAMVAWPSYQDSVRKTRRADAMAAALAIQVAQEKFRGNCAFYAQNLGAGDVCGANAGASTVNASTTSNEGFYTMSIEAGTAGGNAYTVVATATGEQAADTACTPMKIAFSAANPNGLKTPADCW